MSNSTYLELADIDVNGCGDDVKVILKVNTASLTNDLIKRVTVAIEKYQEENPGEWDSDGCFNAAAEQLKTEGYEVEWVIPSATIEF